ncbi:MAG TPA: hypothetical protein VN256_00730 [Pyrinomonadaceae bacterium]|nr:hypothetical protein [Pyrinomonadaceae bacterium]
MDPEELLRAGSKILEPLMRPHGFIFVEGLSGKSGHGDFARGDFVRGERRLELHFRYTLGLVTYHVGSNSVSHESYMRELLGPGGTHQYPGFSDDPLDGFRHLAHDVERFADDFLVGSGEVLARAALKEAAEEKAQQALDMARAVGDTEKREDARRLFRENNFKGVVELLESLAYPELMTQAEKKYLDISKRKINYRL